MNSGFGCQDEVVYEQRVLADRPVRMDVIETEQQMEKQMENRLAERICVWRHYHTVV